MKVKRNINHARKRVEHEIKGIAQRDDLSSALSSEGYQGGYRDCLNDILLLLNGIKPQRRDYWDDFES